jgi:hypothetical protein
MSHASVISKLKTGFHLRRIPWGFNADHQPVGGKWCAYTNGIVYSILELTLWNGTSSTTRPSDWFHSLHALAWGGFGAADRAIAAG